MHSSPLVPVLVLASCVLLAAPSGSATVANPAPPTSGLTEARALVDGGRFGEALAILRPLTTGRTVGAEVLFLIGLAAAGAAQQPGVRYSGSRSHRQRDPMRSSGALARCPSTRPMQSRLHR